MIDDGADQTSGSRNARSVLVRTLTTPPALPWDQSKIAQLEAIQSSPARGLLVRIRRLSPWRPGAGGAFAAVYARPEDIGDGFKTRQRVGGRSIVVRFGPENETATRMRAATTVVFVIGGVALATAAFILALNIRHEREAALAVAEQAANRQLAHAKSADRRARAAGLLAQRSDSGAPIATVIKDLSAMSAARDGAVAIEGVHWRPEGIGIEVRGEEQPFTDKTAERSAKPLRPGVWLWARPNTPDAGRPVAATVAGR